MKILNVYERVTRIMKTEPETRDNDGLLIALFDMQLNPAVQYMPYIQVMEKRQVLGLPSCESIRRARQKAQELHPELKASKAAADARLDKRIEVEDFARSTKA